MEIFYAGRAKSIFYCEGTLASREDAEALVPGNRISCIAKIDWLLRTLGDRGTLQSPDQFRNEGDGIWAVRANNGFRAYGWLGDFEGVPAFFVSHFLLKKQQKLDPRDLEIAVTNRARYLEMTNGN